MRPSKALTMNAESLAKVDEKLRKYAEEQASENLDGSPSDTIKDVPPKDKKLPQGKQEEGDQEWIHPILTVA
jgi:hypothetical protein